VPDNSTDKNFIKRGKTSEMCAILHLGKGSSATYNYLGCVQYMYFKYTSRHILHLLEVTPYILVEVNIDYSEKFSNSKNHVNWPLGVLKAAGSYETLCIFKH
jgi:hypothetical protein